MVGWRMMAVLGLSVLLALAPFSGRAEGPAGIDGDAIRDRITAQFDAFETGDLAAAFAIASPGIQALFGSPQGFATMVQRGYPMVWRPAEVRYLGVRQEQGLIWQRVMIRDRSGVLHLFDYQMVPSASGWRINGVRPVETGVGA